MSKEELIDFYYSKSRKEDEDWYQEARDYCEDLSNEYQIPLRVVVGILASLSPKKRWELNKKMTETFLECQECKHTTTQAKKAHTIYMMSKVNPLPKDIVQDSHIMLLLGGEKTKAFYHNIMYPQTSGYVTLDAHMLKIFNKGNLKITKNQYQALSNYFIQKAHKYQIPVSALQARLWVAIRGK